MDIERAFSAPPYEQVLTNTAVIYQVPLTARTDINVTGAACYITQDASPRTVHNTTISDGERTLTGRTYCYRCGIQQRISTIDVRRTHARNCAANTDRPSSHIACCIYVERARTAITHGQSLCDATSVNKVPLPVTADINFTVAVDGTTYYAIADTVHDTVVGNVECPLTGITDCQLSSTQ